MEDSCWNCEKMREPEYKYDGNTYTEEEIAEDHERCHGWYHCSGSCCGPCPTCQQCADDWEDEDATEEGDE